MGANLIKSDRNRKLRVIQGYITNPSGTAAINQGTGFTIVRNGAGDVSITLSRPGRRLMGVTLTPLNATAATGHSAKLLAIIAASAIQVGTYVADATDSAPADMSFFFSITVSDVAL